MGIEDQISESQLLSLYLSNPLRNSVSHIADIIHKAPVLCNLKDVSTRKYLLTNDRQTELSGLQPEEMIGLTIEDINCGLYEGGRDAHVKKLTELDNQIIADRGPLYHQELFVTYRGFLQSLGVMRIPIAGNSNKVVAILTFEVDLTLRMDLFELLKLYKNLFHPIKQAIAKFLGYFEVDTYFREMPNNSETKIIIAMVIHPSHKQVARLLNLSHKTVAHHIWLISQKLKEGMTLYSVVEKMRSKWISVHTNQAH